MGLDPLGIDLLTYSVPEVVEELRVQASPFYRLAISSSSGKLKVQAPTPGALKKVLERAGTLGDRLALSKTDVSLLALAIDLREEGETPIIVSDDYAIQNVAEGVNIEYQSLSVLGIRQKYNWVHYCPACFKRYNTGEIKVCRVCGTKLKRKPLLKENTKTGAKIRP